MSVLDPPVGRSSWSPADRDALVVMASLPSIGPSRLRSLAALGSPAATLAALGAGRPVGDGAARAWPQSELAAQVADEARRAGDELGDRLREAGVIAVCRGEDGYPPPLAIDSQAPEVLFVRGDPAVLAARRVGIVGTRNATAAGRATAAELGAALASLDVCVVSGLARGIDAAAHRGVRTAGGRAAGVVGNGLDRAYPRQSADIWEWVALHGLLISEWPPGTTPDAWRFPLRNRILAALSEVVVVVESRAAGGSLITAREALERGVQVMVVPGSTRNPACAGTNQLLVEGAAPVTSVDDVVMALALDHSRAVWPGDGVDDGLDETGDDAGDATVQGTGADTEARAAAACREGPCTIDMVAEALQLDAVTAASVLQRLVRSGALVATDGWYEWPSSMLGPFPTADRSERSTGGAR